MTSPYPEYACSSAVSWHRTSDLRGFNSALSPTELQRRKVWLALTRLPTDQKNQPRVSGEYSGLHRARAMKGSAWTLPNASTAPPKPP